MRWKRMSSRQAGLTANRWPNTPLPGILLILGLLSLAVFSKSLIADETWTGRIIMDEVFKRHELFPYVFEKQTMILIDSAGNRDVRKARRFSRIEPDATVK